MTRKSTDHDIILYQAQVISQSIAVLSQTIALINTIMQQSRQAEEASDEVSSITKAETDVSIHDKHRPPSPLPDFLKGYE